MSKKTAIRRRVYPHHCVLRDRHLAALDATGEAVVDSPFLRLLVYRALNEKETRYTAEISGYGRGRSLDGYAPGSSGYAKLAMGFLARGQFNKDEVLANLGSSECASGIRYLEITAENAAVLFDPATTRSAKFAFLTRIFNDDNPFNLRIVHAFCVYKVIKTIRIVAGKS